MLGGLYGDLPPPTSAPGDDDKPAASVWSSATKMAPPTLRKPSATFAPPTSLLRNARPKTAATTTTVQQQPPATTTTSFHPAALVSVQSTVLEEYDPARPNDYEDYRKDRLRRAKDAEVRKELDRRRREDEEREQREAEARLRDAADQSRASAAALNISGEEAWKRRAAMSGGSAQRASSPPPPADGGGGFNIPGSSTSGLGLGAGGQLTAAQRMMAKMGWKEGQGLGKQEQGITAPLVARKTDRRAGVIVDESSSRQEKKPKSVNIEGPPTRVLLLRNMRRLSVRAVRQGKASASPSISTKGVQSRLLGVPSRRLGAESPPCTASGCLWPAPRENRNWREGKTILAGWEGNWGPSIGEREGRERGELTRGNDLERRERRELLSRVLPSSGQICCCSPICRPPQLRPSLWPSFWHLPHALGRPERRNGEKDGKYGCFVASKFQIGPGEVDDELEDEVASECSKYGTVLRVLIFEITQANFPADEAVRIFVLFERTEESTKALVDLDKRFFGGRVVHATFFDEERFGRNELAPMPGEVAGFD
ncbi:hypothetical protein ACQ4PT_041619 [Festuca glaucescens]